jgi:hypothetical protein
VREPHISLDEDLDRTIAYFKGIVAGDSGTMAEPALVV